MILQNITAGFDPKSEVMGIFIELDVLGFIDDYVQ